MKLILWLILFAAAPGWAADADSLRVAPDFHAPAAPGLRYSFGGFSLRESPGSAAGYLAVTLNPGIMQWAAPPTRFDAILTGAGAATSMGMFLGAVGTTLGWFDEDTSWAITGAMAAAGAIYAGARYEVKPELKFNWEGDSVIPGYAPPR
ncbi:MAG TPA: hypothetical protein VF247_08925 [Candidatus Krumholzibacteria bacterium]